jgi:hypothetical protein
MEMLAMTLLVVGLALAAAGYVWIVRLAFGQGKGWGWACVFLNVAQYIFIARHWRAARAAFALEIAGALLIIGWKVLGGEA